jgi:hypothetical protein
MEFAAARNMTRSSSGKISGRPQPCLGRGGLPFLLQFAASQMLLYWAATVILALGASKCLGFSVNATELAFGCAFTAAMGMTPVWTLFRALRTLPVSVAKLLAVLWAMPLAAVVSALFVTGPILAIAFHQSWHPTNLIIAFGVVQVTWVAVIIPITVLFGSYAAIYNYLLLPVIAFTMALATPAENGQSTSLSGGAIDFLLICGLLICGSFIVTKLLLERVPAYHLPVLDRLGGLG